MVRRRGRGDAAAATWIFRRARETAPRRRAGSSGGRAGSSVALRRYEWRQLWQRMEPVHGKVEFHGFSHVIEEQIEASLNVDRIQEAFELFDQDRKQYFDATDLDRVRAPRPRGRGAAAGAKGRPRARVASPPRGASGVFAGGAAAWLSRG